MSSSAADKWGYCPNCCPRATQVVVDQATGDTICTECALVLDAHYFDEGSSDDLFLDAHYFDEGSDDDLFLDAKLSTVITYSNRCQQVPRSPAEDVGAARRRGAYDKTLVDGFRRIDDMADRLGLVADIRDQAKETFKKLNEAMGCSLGRNRDSGYAACLYVACRSLGMPRTYKELTTVTAQGAAARKDICKMTTHIKRLLGREDDSQVLGFGVVRF